ncbi:MAG: hypothetical protein AAF664_21060 [Planctomycetota bacterium]
MRHSLIAAIVFYLISDSSISHADSLDGQLYQAARKIASVMQEQGHHHLALGEFTSLEGTPDSYGPGLRVELSNAFAEVAIAEEQETPVSVIKQSIYRVSGTYQVMDDPEDALAPESGVPQMLVLKIDLMLRERGEDLFPVTLFVDRVRDIARVSGTSGLFRLEDDARELHRQIRVKRAKPTFIVDGTKIRSSSESDVAVEILTRSALAGDSVESKPRTVLTEGGTPTVPVAVGEVYEVRIHNLSDDEIAVSMSVDGIDQFTFSEDRDSATGRPRLTHWLIGANRTFTIKGWHRTSDDSRSDNLLRFLVTKYGDGASQFVPQVDRSRVGFLQLAISKSHLSGRGTRGDSETGFGPPVEQKQTVVRRQIDPPHEFLTVRYTQ